MVKSSTLYLSLASTAAWSGTAAETILTILEAASVSTTQPSLRSVASASSALDAASLCCIGIYTYKEARRGGSRDRATQTRVLNSVIILISGGALLVNLVVVILIKSNWTEVISQSSGPVVHWDTHTTAHIALWVVSLVTQLCLYSSPLWHQRAPNVQTINTSGPRDSVMSECRAYRQGKNLHMEPTHSTFPIAAALPSPTFSTRSSHSLKSFRESLRHVVRPATSRTTLISRPSHSRDARSIYSQADSVDTMSHFDAFESWDTSSVSLQARDAVLQTAPSKGTTLDPIPGSRPATPARGLDGPYLTELPEEEELTPPPKLMPDVSRPPSPAVSEAHIHPLFRTESPVPPPEATPGTSIVASPLASQAIACPPRSFNRMRSNSHLSQAQRSIRGRATSPQTTSRTPSPPSRELTPPIPDYVLNSSPRSSMSGSRRVQLQYSPDR